MKQIAALLSIFVCMPGFPGCSGLLDSNTPGSLSTANPETLRAEQIEILGTIVYKSIEGGFFAIEGIDGSAYDPVNLPESWKKDGLRVKVSARLPTDVMSVHMHGTLIEILTIDAQ